MGGCWDRGQREHSTQGGRSVGRGDGRVVGTQHPHRLGRMLSVGGGTTAPVSPPEGAQGGEMDHRDGVSTHGGRSVGTTAPTEGALGTLGPQHPYQPWGVLRGCWDHGEWDHSTHGGCSMAGGCSEGAGSTAPAPAPPGAEWDTGSAAPTAPGGDAPPPAAPTGTGTRFSPGARLAALAPRALCLSFPVTLPRPRQTSEEAPPAAAAHRNPGCAVCPPRCAVSPPLGAAGLCPGVAAGLRPANSPHTWGTPSPNPPKEGETSQTAACAARCWSPLPPPPPLHF